MYSGLRTYASTTTANNARSRAKKAVSAEAKAAKVPATEETPSNPPKPYKSRIEAFLQDLDVRAKQGPSLQDFENMKPVSSAGPQSVGYRQEYDQATKRIIRAFQSSQLIELVNLSGYEGKIPMTSRELVEILLDRVWEWPLPEDVAKRHKEETEKVIAEIPVSTSLVLLLLVEDPHVFPKLEKRFKLNLSLDTSKGTVLQAAGVTPDLERLAAYLAQRELELVSASSDIITGDLLTPSLLQTAIKATKCHIETSMSDEKIHFTAFDDTAIKAAQRLVERLVAQSSREKKTLLIAQQSLKLSSRSQDPDYALLPFFPSKAMPTLLGGSRLFRVHKVSRPSDDTGRSSEVTTTFVGLPSPNFDLEQQAIHNSVIIDGTERSLTASLGHIVFSSLSKEITAPVPGSWTLGHGLKRLAEYPLSRHFIPSQPSPLLHQNPSAVSTVHRAIYYGRTPSDPPADRITIPRNNVFVLDVLMRQEVSSPELDDLDEQEQEVIAIVPSNGPTRCRSGSEQTVDVLLPDRYMDMRLTIQELKPVKDELEPKVIQEYIAELSRFLNFQVDQQPTAPQSFDYEGMTYVLDTSSSIRQTKETLLSQTNGWEDSFNTYSQYIEATSETSLDLESKDKSMHCFIKDIVENRDDLHGFLERANAIAALPYSPNTESSQTRTPVFIE